MTGTAVKTTVAFALCPQCRERVRVDLGEAVSQQIAERDRLRVDAHGVFASWCLIPFEPVGPSWPRDRFETWIDRLAEHAGIDLRGLSVDEARCREMLPAALEGE